MYKDKILLVDDEKVFCDMMKMHLEAIGNFEVAVAYDGKEGMRLARKIKPDAIVLDILMPKMNGFELTVTLKKDKLYKSDRSGIAGSLAAHIDDNCNDPFRTFTYGNKHAGRV